MRHSFQHDVMTFETAVLSCFAVDGSSLPQIESDDDVIVDIIQDTTFRPKEQIDAEIHHQIDPSYQ